MKNILSICLLLMSTLLFAQGPVVKVKGKRATGMTLVIQSSTVCDMCVKTIKENLIYEKGVKSVEVNLLTSTVHIEYNPHKNTPEALRAALIKLGYSADGVPGDAKAFANLPACCQKEGCGKLPEDGTH